MEAVTIDGCFLQMGASHMPIVYQSHYQVFGRGDDNKLWNVLNTSAPYGEIQKLREINNLNSWSGHERWAKGKKMKKLGSLNLKLPNQSMLQESQTNYSSSWTEWEYQNIYPQARSNLDDCWRIEESQSNRWNRSLFLLSTLVTRHHLKHKLQMPYHVLSSS